MIKARKIGLILDKDILIEAFLKDGNIINVTCEFINAEYDRLYLKFPTNQKALSQYFYEGRQINLNLDTLDGRKIYSSIVIYPPTNNLLVVEYNKANVIISQKRQLLRVRSIRNIDIKTANGNVSALTVDISCGGCKILSPVEFQTGDILESQLTLNTNEEKVEAYFKVLSSTFLPAENKYEITGEFINLQENAKKAITKFCYKTQTKIIRNTNKNT